MNLREALSILALHRGERIVVPTMASVGVWPEMSDTPLDFAYIPSSMGQAPALALGLALAQPSRGVVAVCGDGSMLMNLGALVTIAAQPANLFVVIIDNGLYEVTGGQPTAGSGRTDWAGLAQAAGIGRVYSFDSESVWRHGAAEALAGIGPVVIVLKVDGRIGCKTPAPPRPMSEQIERLQQALGVPPVKTHRIAEEK
jgi:thiamine pyrophosphate-dependent acetolactate synthase large subunit-like protein